MGNCVIDEANEATDGYRLKHREILPMVLGSLTEMMRCVNRSHDPHLKWPR